MIKHTTIALLALVAGVTFAQTTPPAAPDGPGNGTAVKPAPEPKVVQKVENSRPMKATKRGLTKANAKLQKGAQKGENAVRRGSRKVGEKAQGNS